jgi:hypothetical protein
MLDGEGSALAGFGISFGTSHVRAAIAEAKRAPSLLDFGGANEMPALAAFEAGGVAIGADAIGAQAKEILRGVKQLLASERGLEAASFLARRALDAAAHAAGKRPAGAVVTASAWLDDAAVRALQSAHKRAGIRVQRVLSDAAAAGVFLASSDATDRRVAIVDVGSGGVSASVVTIGERRVTWNATAFDTKCGADVIDAPVDARHVEALLASLFDGIERTCATVLERAGATRGSLDAVYASGSMSAMPEIRGCIAAAMGELSRAPLADGAYALGAAIVSAAIQREGDMVLVDDDPRMCIPAPSSTSLLPSAQPTMPPPIVASVPPAVTRSAAPPMRASFAPEARTSLIPVAGTPLERPQSAGEIAIPVTAAALLDLPLSRALSPADTSPIALPVLLRRILGRPEIGGVLTLVKDAERHVVHVADGRAYLNDQEQAAMKRVVAWSRGSYTFEARTVSTGTRQRQSMTPLAVAAIRAMAKRFDAEELLRAFGDAAGKFPMVIVGKGAQIPTLGLEPSERRVIESRLDGRETTAKIVSTGGMPHTSLTVLVVLKLFGMLEFRSP